MQTGEPAYNLTGLSIADTSNPITTYHQIGGGRTVFNTVLAVPSHLNAGSTTPGDAPWNSLEHVVIPPLATDTQAVASVGEHVQATDEIYFILQGRGRLTTNGASSLVSAGSLVIAPRWTRHSIENPSSGVLTFLVIELHAPPDSTPHHPLVIEHLPEAEAVGLQALLGVNPVPLRVWGLDLAGYFSAPWGELSMIELPPGARIEEYSLAEQDENLFVAAGFATIFVADVRIDPPDNGWHRNVVVPWGVPRRIVNSSMRDPLRILSVRVHRKVAGPARPRRAEGMGAALASGQ